MQPDKAVGSTWLWRLKGKLWPVVLCGDDTPPQPFMNSRNDTSAVPAIQLGRHKFIWVTLAGLEEFDPSKDYLAGPPTPKDSPLSAATSEDETLENQRRAAFERDALEFENDHYWTNFILNKSAARKADRDLQAKHKPNKAKRKRQHENRTLTPSLTPTKYSGDDVRQSIEHADDDDERFDEYMECYRPFKHGRQQPHTVSQDNDRNVEEDENEDNEADPETRLQENLMKIKKNPLPIDMCTIMIGPELTPFTVSRIYTGKFNFLANREIWTEELGSHINLDSETDIDEHRFKPIAEYLRGGDFAPRFRKSMTTDRFAQAIMPHEQDQASAGIILTYHTAAKIECEEIQNLCFRKLRLLDLLGSKALVAVARIAHMTDKHEFEVEKRLQGWLADELARRLWQVADFAFDTLTTALREDVELSQEVYKRLAKNPRLGFEGLDN